ncbi:MAG TPA: DUF5819 family protein, partial [Bacteroidia bacterium]|nr:DUF5819 family protein [Bacteroidia bacterium]
MPLIIIITGKLLILKIKQRFKIFFFYSGLLVLTVHFILVFFYALPVQTKNKLTFFSQAYVYPFFHQNWSLFAPVPDSNYQLIAVYDKGARKKDIFAEIVHTHQSNRLAGMGPLVLAFSNSIHYFEKNTLLLDRLNGPIKNDTYFSIIEHEVRNYLSHSENIKDQKIKLLLLVENARTGAKRA